MKYIFSSILLLFCLTTINAQTIQDVILTIPDDVVVGLTTEQKTQLCADPATDSVAVENVLNGQIIRLAISNDYVSLQTSDVGTTQIKILPLVNDTKILAVVKTVCSDACDSRIQFYTLDWRLLPEQSLLPIRTFDWFIKQDIDRQSSDFKDAIKAVDMNPILLNFSPTDYSLTADSEIGNYISSEDYAGLASFLTGKPKVFVWDKISFKGKSN
ncbi:MAG: hypothetical protein H6Q14_1530 [Bacteroidetes bacterium]|nr:hypothetical protein [Bacteroidota bacterium]